MSEPKLQRKAGFIPAVTYAQSKRLKASPPMEGARGGGLPHPRFFEKVH